MGVQLQAGLVGSQEQLSALHLSAYCLVKTSETASASRRTDILSPCASRNYDMNLTFLIPPRGSAFPQSSLLHPVSWELGESASSKRWKGGWSLSKQPSLFASETQLAQTLAKNDGLIHFKIPSNCMKRHETGNPVKL